jgi:hypothetical protein
MASVGQREVEGKEPEPLARRCLSRRDEACMTPALALCETPWFSFSLP